MYVAIQPAPEPYDEDELDIHQIFTTLEAAEHYAIKASYATDFEVEVYERPDGARPLTRVPRREHPVSRTCACRTPGDHWHLRTTDCT